MKRQTWKTLLTCIISIVLVCTTCFAVFAENAADSGEFTVQGTTLVKYNGNGGEVTVPDGIKALGAGAFEGTKVTKVNLPESLQEIGKNCFRKCEKLAEITLPVHLWRISDESVFGNNPALKEIKVAEGNPTYKSVDGVLFTAKGEKLVYYPDGKNGGYAIPEGTKMVGQAAFCAPDMETLSIPASLRKMDSGVLAGIQSLKDINVAADNRVYSSKDGVLYNKNNALLVKPAAKKAAEEKAAAEKAERDFTIQGSILVKYNGNGGEVTVPDGIVALGEEAFQDSRVTKVILPEGLTSIGHHCFFGCYELEEITLPASLSGVENMTQPFSSTPKLKEFRVAEGSKYYKAVDGVLFTADGKKLVCYPDGKADIEYAIPEGTESFGESPFQAAQFQYITIPSTLVDMGDEYRIFTGLDCLQEIEVSPENPKYYAERGVLYTGNRLVAYPAAKYWTKLKPTDLPAGLKEIGHNAFWGNRYLESVEFPEGIEKIGGKIFVNARALQTIVVPASVKEIGFLAFTDCSKLERVTILNPDVNILNGYGDSDPKKYNLLCWADTSNAVICGYPGGKLQEYAEKCGLTFEALEGTPEPAAETVQEAVEEKAAAESSASDFTIEGNKLVRYNGAGGEITVPDGVEILGEWAFSHSGVTKVNLPETVKVIEHYCFHSSEDLTEVNLPASLTQIDETQAFAYNPKLEAINIPEGNPFYTSVDGVLFTGDMKTLMYYPGGKNPGGEYAIPEGTETLSRTAFEGSSLTAVSLPASLETLEGGNDFSSNYELKEIRVAEGNKAFRSIDGMLFDHSGKLLCYPAGREQETLEAGDFPAEMTAIGPYAFQFAQHLKNVTIPDGITTIEWMCFTFSPSLETVMLPTSVNYIAGYAFADCPELRQVVILNPDAYIVLDDERFSDDYRATMNFNIVDDSPNAIIYGYKGSTAEDYAAQRNDTFVSLGEAPARNSEAASEVVVPEWVPGCAQ